MSSDISIIFPPDSNIDVTMDNSDSTIDVNITTISSDINVVLDASSYVEVDPFFTAWDKSSGIQILENQITDLGDYATNSELTTSLDLKVDKLGFISTENNYSDIDKFKLEGIQSGAEVNVNSDWNAVSGDAQILNKPDITAISRQAISETVEGLSYSDSTGVLSLTSGYIIPTLTNFNNKVDKELNKGLSENNFTNTLKSKLDGIESGAQQNTVDSVNGQINTVVLTTTDIAQGTNEYYTNNKVDSRITAQKGIASGLCPLDIDTKIPITYIPDALTSALTYMGAWDASVGTYPTETPTTGNYWLISVAGTIDSIDYNVGDWLIYNSDVGWNRIPLGIGSNVSSVNNKTGDVVLTTTDIAQGINEYYTEAKVNNNTEVQKGITANSWGNHANAGYALDSNVVHDTGSETIYGDKTFDDNIFVNDRVAIGATSFDLTNPEFLKVDGDSSSSVNIISGYGTYNDYLQLNIKNRSSGTSSSSDIVATADIGQEGSNYIDLGIHGSNYSNETFDIVGALDGYTYVDGGNLALGTASSDKKLIFFTGGTLQENKRAELSDTNLTLSVNVSANNLSGSNTGDETNSSIKTKLGVDLTNKLNYNGNGSSLTGITATQIGLSNIDNTSDLNKPISTATQIELNKIKNLAIAMAVAL